MTIQQDFLFNASGSKRTSHSFGDIDTAKCSTTTKRQRLDHILSHFTNKDLHACETSTMDVTMDDSAKVNHSNASTNYTADEILVQMVQSGCYSQDDVVNFCISTGIPLSRMLRLDLIRVYNHSKR